MILKVVKSTCRNGQAASPIKEWLELLHGSAISRGVTKDADCYAKPDDLPYLLSGKKCNMWRKGLWKPEEYLSPEGVEKAMPNMRNLVELCEKYKVPRWDEGSKCKMH